MLRTDCNVLVTDCVFEYSRSGETILRMAEEEYMREKLDYGEERGSA